MVNYVNDGVVSYRILELCLAVVGCQPPVADGMTVRYVVCIAAFEIKMTSNDSKVLPKVTPKCRS